MNMTIRTNRHWRDFTYRADVPEHILARQFDHLDEEASDGFLCYRGYWYHTSDFMRCPADDAFKGWHGYLADSFYSGILITMSRDGEQYRIATFSV